MPRFLVPALCSLFVASAAFAAPPGMKLLFLGDNAGHRPAERFRILNGLEASAQVKVRDKVKIVVD